MKKWVCVVAILVVSLLGGFLDKALLTDAGKPTEPTKSEIAQKIQHIQVPFIANKGQADEQVKFYATTFGGTVFVTKDGGIVYALPERSSASEGENSAEKSDSTHTTLRLRGHYI